MMIDSTCPQCGHSIINHDGKGCSDCDCTLRDENFVFYLRAEIIATRNELDTAKSLMHIYVKERDIALRQRDSAQRLANRYFCERVEARRWAGYYQKLAQYLRGKNG